MSPCFTGRSVFRYKIDCTCFASVICSPFSFLISLTKICILKSADGETNSYYGIDVGTLASVAAAHTKQLKEDFDKTILDLENKIKTLQEQLNNVIMK